MRLLHSRRAEATAQLQKRCALDVAQARERASQVRVALALYTPLRRPLPIPAIAAPTFPVARIQPAVGGCVKKKKNEMTRNKWIIQSIVLEVIHLSTMS